MAKPPPKAFKPEILRQIPDDRGRAQLLARQLGIPVSDEADAEKLWAAVGRVLWECVPEPKRRRGKPHKPQWERELARIVDFIIMGEILRRPKRKASHTIEYLTRNKEFAPNKEDLRRRHNTLKKELTESGHFEELEEAIRHEGRHLLARFTHGGWKSPLMHLHEAAEVIAEGQNLREQIDELSGREVDELNRLCLKPDYSGPPSRPVAKLLPRLLQFGRELHRLGLSDGIGPTYEVTVELSKK